jgi:ribulose-phosphate 3-epimerase
MAEIVPNIITADLDEVKEKLKKLQGISEWVHFDIADGKFSNKKTVSIKQIKDLPLLKKINSSFHLMVVEPIGFIKDLKEIKAKVVVAQIERMADQEKFVKEVKKQGMKAGLALDDGSRVEDIDKKILGKLEIVLVMTIKAGWSGRSFKKSRLKEVEKLKSLKKKMRYNYKIAVDGGVNEKTIKDCVKAGGELLFMHSAVWKGGEVGERIKKLELLIK